MEVKLKANIVRVEREKRAWSQEHLAAVAGLGVRTVQRLESANSASLESIKAIASAFEMSIAELRCTEGFVPIKSKVFSRRIGLGAFFASFFLIALGQLVVSPIFANEVLLDYRVVLENSVEGKDPEVKSEIESRYLAKKGETATVNLPNLVKIEIAPVLPNSSEGLLRTGEILRDGEVLLAVKIFVKEGDEFQLMAQPRIITSNKEQAAIHLDDDKGNSLKIAITPTVQPG